MLKVVSHIVVSLLFVYQGDLVAQPLTNNPVKQEVREPEAATGYIRKKAVTGDEFMIAVANPYASQAGFDILNQGGSAVDAVIAAQLVLTLVEPQSSGIGGGAFMLHWHEKNQHLTTFDGRETAPKLASSDLFLAENGKPLRWIEAVVGGKSVGVPGVLLAMKKAHDKYGKLPWKTLFTAAIDLAENGFVVSARLEKLLALGYNPGIHSLPEINQYFFPNGQSVKAGDILKNPKLAKSLKSIANDGVEVFYRGWLAKKIVDKVQKSSIAPGLLSLDDMKNYQAKQRDAVCGQYHQFKVCGMAPPSSGGISVIQILAQLESFNMSQYEVNSLSAVHLLTQSFRLAFADRDKYVADTDFVSVPVQGLIDDDYLASRAKLINIKKDMGKASAGKPLNASLLANDDAIERPSTSHLSVVDSDGNAVSMTSSIENGFGSALMVEGFILNNQLTDFSLSPKRQGKLVANRVEAGKRPRSSMAPIMVFNDDNSLKLVIGSPGGSRIINYVAQTLIGVLDWDLNVQEAINLPKVTNRNRLTTLEQGTAIESLKPKLEAKGHKVSVRSLNSGLQAIEIKNGKLIGGADPRREGLVLAK
ncbi:gamma-glutamyltransferase [Litorilituus lipolyticus]|uniref:Glutathione hydrolase proenzyme n=1 Tax=Litorilituus lipolyticus TaxID=2491017 RepID=A0A502L2G0_9GAMM|nr:gamma-glutamyltransferase [Litorilituus lipolyticus]TPH16411.1 gamma-glutamyltransferase [Litorilituus lipolyticus]